MNFFLKKKAERWFSPIDRSLRRELKAAFGSSYWFDTTTYKEVVDLRIEYGSGILQIFFPKYKIAPSSARIFCFMDNFTWSTFNFNCFSFFKKIKLVQL